MADRRRAIVVGGGIAGLTIARDLAIGDLEVVLLEALGVVGGKVARHDVAGVLLDAGAESYATRGGTVSALAAELGLSPLLPDPAGAWLQPASGAPVPLPKTGLLGIPSVPLAGDVIAVIGLPAALRAQLDLLMLGFTGSRERTLGGLVRKRMGRTLVEKLVAPIVIGIHSKHPDELDVDVVAPHLRAELLSESSLAHAVGRLRAAAPAGSAVAGFDGGIGELVQRLADSAARVGVRTRTGARVVRAEAKSVTLADGEVVEGDLVVLATPLEPAGATSITLATLVVESAALDSHPRGTGLLVAPGHPTVLAKALTHATAKWQWLADRMPPHQHVLRLSYSVPVADLQEQARADAELLLGVPIPPTAVLGFARRDWTAVPAAPEPTPGVTLVGEPVAGTGLASVIAQARSEAERLLEAIDT